MAHNNFLRNAIFILGSPRSGTTFLGNCLASIPEISYHYEPIITKIASEYIYRDLIGFKHAKCLYYSVYSSLMLPHLGQGRRFAEKTPRNCTIAPFLSQTFPDSKFIHIVRDGRDATVSHLKKPWLLAATDRLPFWHPYRYAFGSHARYWVEESRKNEFSLTTDTHRVIWNWRRYNELTLTTGNKLSDDRYLRISYENMANNPDDTAERILNFLQIQNNESSDQFKIKMNTMHTGSVGQWHELLSNEQLEIIYKEAENLLSTLGYLKHENDCT